MYSPLHLCKCKNKISNEIKVTNFDSYCVFIIRLVKFLFPFFIYFSDHMSLRRTPFQDLFYVFFSFFFSKTAGRPPMMHWASYIYSFINVVFICVFSNNKKSTAFFAHFEALIMLFKK